MVGRAPVRGGGSRNTETAVGRWPKLRSMAEVRASATVSVVVGLSARLFFSRAGIGARWFLVVITGESVRPGRNLSNFGIFLKASL